VPVTSAGTPIVIPGQNFVEPGPPIVTPQQPVQTQLPPTIQYRPVPPPITPPTPTPFIAQQPTTPVPAQNIGVASANAGLDLSGLMGQLNNLQPVITVITTAAPTQAPIQQMEAFTVPGALSFVPQPPITTAGAMITRVGAATVLPGQPVITPRDALTIPQQPIAVQVPRQATRQVPACQTITEPCALPTCVTYSCSYRRSPAARYTRASWEP